MSTNESTEIERLEARVEELEAELKRRGSPRTRLHSPTDPDNYWQPPQGWVCFHCGDSFDHPEDAARHFGDDPQGETPCYVQMRERALKAEALLKKHDKTSFKIVSSNL